MHHKKVDSQQERRRSRGATAVEYALIVALIAAIIIAAVSQLGTSTQDLFQEVEEEYPDP